MAIINNPPTNAVDMLSAEGVLSVNDGWRNFFQSVFTICSALTQSGTTANRPVKLLWTGRMYFDTTLGLPIWYKTAGWVKADGTAA